MEISTEQSGQNVDEASVTEKLDADICPLCQDVFYEAQELIEHVFGTHFISSKETCSKCLTNSDLDSGICTICQNVCDTPRDLLKHVFEKHCVSLELKCIKCLKSSHQTKSDLAKKSVAFYRKKLDLLQQAKNSPSDEGSGSNIKQNLLGETLKVEDSSCGDFNASPIKIEHVKIEENISVVNNFQWEEDEPKKHCFKSIKHFYENQIKCPHCAMYLLTSQEYFKHLKSEHRVQCGQCDMHFLTNQELHSHWTSQHNESLIKCPHCDMYLLTNQEYSNHLKSDHWTCGQCDKHFTTMHELHSHWKSQHDNKSRKLVKCEKCSMSFETTAKLYEHFSEEHLDKSRVKCAKCNTFYASAKEFSEHINAGHIDAKYVCDICKKHFITNHQLMQHNRQCHPFHNSVGRYCYDCEISFTTKKELKIHRALHTFKCLTCEAHFGSKLTFQAHTNKCWLQTSSNKVCQSQDDKNPTKTNEDVQANEKQIPESDGCSVPKILKKSVFICDVTTRCDWTANSEEGLQNHIAEKHQTESDCLVTKISKKL